MEDGPPINESTKLLVQFGFSDGAFLELDQAAVYSISQCDRLLISRIEQYLEALEHPPIKCTRERAERMFETGNYVGIDAYTVTGNPFMGEYGEPVFHVRLGNVPPHEGWE